MLDHSQFSEYNFYDFPIGGWVIETKRNLAADARRYAHIHIAIWWKQKTNPKNKLWFWIWRNFAVSTVYD